MRSEVHLEDLASVFSTMSEQYAVVAAGEDDIVGIYNGEHRDGLDTFRYIIFPSKVMLSATCIHQYLLPTSATANLFVMDAIRG